MKSYKQVNYFIMIYLPFYPCEMYVDNIVISGHIFLESKQLVFNLWISRGHSTPK